jgi:AraC family transcriptional activator of mtrCDE
LARQRLVQTNAAIDQIAEDVGYDSPAAFSRAFLRKYGERPGEIRRRAE